MKNKPVNPALLLKCKLAVSKAGGYTKLGKAIGCSPQSVYKWQVVPFNRCVAVAEFIGWQPWDIRPDIFVKDDADASPFETGSNTKTASRTKPKMDGKATAGSKGPAVKRRNGGKRRAGNGNRQKSGSRKDIPRSGNVANGMVKETENAETLPA